MPIELPLCLSREDVRDMAMRSKKRAETAIVAFTRELVKDPFHAMEWSQEEYRATASLDIANLVLHQLQNDTVTVEAITMGLFNETIRGACFPKESTSPVANLLASYRTVVYARMLKDILGM